MYFLLIKLKQLPSECVCLSLKKPKKWMRLIGIGMVRMSGSNIVTW